MSADVKPRSWSLWGSSAVSMRKVLKIRHHAFNIRRGFRIADRATTERLIVTSCRTSGMSISPSSKPSGFAYAGYSPPCFDAHRSINLDRLFAGAYPPGMKSGPDLARIASLIGDPARANMLAALMGSIASGETCRSRADPGASAGAASVLGAG
jgi:hypothetical protein